MYSTHEYNFIKKKVDNFLKSTGLPYYDEKYIRTQNSQLTEIDFILDINNCNVCIFTKFINPAPSSSTITKFISNLNIVKEITNKEIYAILLLKSEISHDDKFQLMTHPIKNIILNNDDKEILYKMFMEFMYSNNIFIKDSDGDTVMLNL